MAISDRLSSLKLA